MNLCVSVLFVSSVERMAFDALPFFFSSQSSD